MDAEAIEPIERVLRYWTAAEVVGLLVLGWLLWGSLFGQSGFLATVSRPVRMAGLAFVVLQLAILLVVYLDVRRRDCEPGMLWVHVAAMPVLNVFGLWGYLAARRKQGSDRVGDRIRDHGR